MLHLHGRAVHFELASHLPLQIVNWHDRETSPSLARARQAFTGGLCGGLRQDTLVFGDSGQVEAEAAHACRETRNQGFLLSTGCVVPVIAPFGNILAARRSVEAVK
jgi:uroporphyrinogen decarboxylase